MSVSGGSTIMHVGLRCVSDQACRSPAKHVSLLCGMSVSDGACRSLMKHVEVSDGSLIIIIFS